MSRIWMSHVTHINKPCHGYIFKRFGVCVAWGVCVTLGNVCVWVCVVCISMCWCACVAAFFLYLCVYETECACVWLCVCLWGDRSTWECTIVLVYWYDSWLYLCWSALRSQSHCNTLQYTVTHYNTPPHTATYYNELQHTHCICLVSVSVLVGCCPYPCPCLYVL